MLLQGQLEVLLQPLYHALLTLAHPRRLLLWWGPGAAGQPGTGLWPNPPLPPGSSLSNRACSGDTVGCRGQNLGQAPSQVSCVVLLVTQWRSPAVGRQRETGSENTDLSISNHNGFEFGELGVWVSPLGPIPGAVHGRTEPARWRNPRG